MLGSAIYDLSLLKLEESSPFGVNSDDGVLLGGGDELTEVKPVGHYVREQMRNAANEILLVSPLHLLGFKPWPCRAVADASDSEIGSIALPLDFLRIHTLKMEGWSRGLHEVYKVGSADYELQQNRWTRGSWSKPAATLSGSGRTVELLDAKDFTLCESKYWGAHEEGARTIYMSNDNPKGEQVHWYQWSDFGTIVRMSFHGVYWDEIAHTTRPSVDIDYFEPARLRYYSVRKGLPHTVEEFNYIERFSDSADYNDSIAELIALNCARKVQEVFGNSDQTGVIAGEIDSILGKL